MSVCLNCGKSLNAFNEAYGFTGKADEKLCGTCRTKINKVIQGYTLTADFVAQHRSELLSNGVTESGIKHLQKAIDMRYTPEEASEVEQETKLEMRQEAQTKEVCCTTTDSFLNAEIEEYLGIVTGTGIYLVGGVFGEGLANQEKLFNRAFETAKERMLQKAYERGANAVVGMQVSFSSPGEQNNMIVVLTGTAVIISKKEETNGREDHTNKLVEAEQAETVKKKVSSYNEEESIMSAEEDAAERIEDTTCTDLDLNDNKPEKENKKQFQEETSEQLQISQEDDQTTSLPVRADERQKLIDAIGYALNLTHISRTRAKLKQIETESGQEIIDFLLSLPDSELKPVAYTVLDQLKNEE